MKKIFLILLSILMIIPFGSFAAISSATESKATTEVTAEPVVGSIQDAMKEFKSLSRHERKERIKLAKEELKQYKIDKKAGAEPSTNTLLLVILAILIPPLAVYLHEGVINGKFWLDLILTLIFFIPGLIYALIVVLGNSK